MVDVSVSGIVRAQPEDVFGFLANLENWPRWQSDMKTTKLVEGEAGMIRPSGRYVVEPAPNGTRVALNPHPEARGLGRIMAPLIALMIKRLNRQHLDALRLVLERS
jgi:hypothetical protein